MNEPNTTVKSVRKVYAALDNNPNACSALSRKVNLLFYSVVAALDFLEEFGLAYKVQTSSGIRWVRNREQYIESIKETSRVDRKSTKHTVDALTMVSEI